MHFDITENADQFRDKVFACWMGKNIGGTLGTKFEGEKRLLDLHYYDELPDKPLPNDDLDLQLLWLHALEQYGPGLTAQELGQEWQDHVFFPYDEYGFCLTNLRLGLAPPLSGAFGNPFTDCMGSPIRSEIWACISPGNPDVAVHYAFNDAIVDHAGGEGVYGEMFFAALESMAFVNSNRDELIQIGLSYIPDDCRTAKAINAVLKWNAEGRDWLENRQLVLEHYGHENFTDAPQNIAFILIGWLYGDDFGDAICKAVSCGYDTDCTGATLGAILGIIGGTTSLPERWTKPIGEQIVVSEEVNGFPAPKDLNELTDRVCLMAAQVSAWIANHRLTINNETLWSADPYSYAVRIPLNSQIDELLNVVVRYENDTPAVKLGHEVHLLLEVTNKSDVTWNGYISFKSADDWSVPEPIAISLKRGETTTVNAVFVSGNNWLPSYLIEAELTRTYGGSAWSTQRFSTVFLPKRNWLITSEDGISIDAHSDDTQVPFQECGMNPSSQYTAETEIYNPYNQDIRIIVATPCAVKVWLDRRLIIEGEESELFMPAYHRPREGNYCDLSLAKGNHQLKLEVISSAQKDTTEVRVIIVSQKEFMYASKTEIRIG